MGGRALTCLALGSVRLGSCVCACALRGQGHHGQQALPGSVTYPACHSPACHSPQHTAQNTAPAHATPWNCQVALEVDDRGKQRLILRVTADFVRVQASAGAVTGCLCTGGHAGRPNCRCRCRSQVAVRPSNHVLPSSNCSAHTHAQVKSAINSSHNHEELLELLRGALGALWLHAVRPGAWNGSPPAAKQCSVAGGTQHGGGYTTVQPHLRCTGSNGPLTFNPSPSHLPHRRAAGPAVAAAWRGPAAQDPDCGGPGPRQGWWQIQPSLACLKKCYSSQASEYWLAVPPNCSPCGPRLGVWNIACAGQLTSLFSTPRCILPLQRRCLRSCRRAWTRTRGAWAAPASTSSTPGAGLGPLVGHRLVASSPATLLHGRTEPDYAPHSPLLWPALLQHRANGGSGALQAAAAAAGACKAGAAAASGSKIAPRDTSCGHGHAPTAACPLDCVVRPLVPPASLDWPCLTVPFAALTLLPT